MKSNILGEAADVCVCKMAGVSDCFTIGSIVSCKTCHSKDVEGEVMAFDPQSKMLILSILLKLPENSREMMKTLVFMLPFYLSTLAWSVLLISPSKTLLLLYRND